MARALKQYFLAFPTGIAFSHQLCKQEIPHRATEERCFVGPVRNRRSLEITISIQDLQDIHCDYSTLVGRSCIDFPEVWLHSERGTAGSCA